MQLSRLIFGGGKTCRMVGREGLASTAQVCKVWPLSSPLIQPPLGGSSALLTPCVGDHFTTVHCFGGQCGPVSMLEVGRGGRCFARENSRLQQYRYYHLCIVTTGCCVGIFWEQWSLQPYILQGNPPPPLWFGVGRGLG